MEAIIFDAAMTWSLAQANAAITMKSTSRVALMDKVCSHYAQIDQWKPKKDKTVYVAEPTKEGAITINRYLGKRAKHKGIAMSTFSFDPSKRLYTQKAVADKIEEISGWRPATDSQEADILLSKLYEAHLEELIAVNQYIVLLSRVLETVKRFLENYCQDKDFYHNGRIYNACAIISDIDATGVKEYSPFDVGVLLVNKNWESMSLSTEDKHFIDHLDDEGRRLTGEEAAEVAKRSPEVFWYVSFHEFRPIATTSIYSSIICRLEEEEPKTQEQAPSETTEETHEETEEVHEGDTPEQEGEYSQGGDNDGSGDGEQ